MKAQAFKGLRPPNPLFKRMPLADEVRLALTAACRELGCASIEATVNAALRGAISNQGRLANHDTSRARAYAAWALSELFDINRSTASRLVGVGRKSYQAHLPNLASRRRAGLLSWFSDDVLRKVETAIVEHAGLPASALPAPRSLAVKPSRHRSPRIEQPAVERRPILAAPVVNAWGDPPLSRSALATAKPWVPYELSDACRAVQATPINGSRKR